MKVYITRNFPGQGIDMLKEKFDVEVNPENRDIDDETLLEKVSDCDGLVTMIADHIDHRIFEKGKKLKIVANFGVGYNNIDTSAALDAGVVVTHTPDVLSNATAETAFALLIAAARHIVPADRFVREKKFHGSDPFMFLGMELSGKTMGIIGMGRIGREMAKKCHAFGMNVVYYNRNRIDASIEKELNVGYRTMEEIVCISDFLSIHTPLTVETRHMIDKAVFDQMKEGLILINTARGPIIDEADLVEALESGKIRAAGLDVYENEPDVHPGLLKMENVVLLPHIGSATYETRSRMGEVTAVNVIEMLSGNLPPNIVPELARMKPDIKDSDSDNTAG